jgi:hypothetical protein
MDKKCENVGLHYMFHWNTLEMHYRNMTLHELGAGVTSVFACLITSRGHKLSENVWYERYIGFP